MSMRNLIKKLKEQQKSEAPPDPHQKEEWLEAIDILYKRIEGWVEPGVKAGVFETSRTRKDIREVDLGDYSADMLQIKAGHSTVRFEPVGRSVVGMMSSGNRRLLGLRGRVDLICGPIKIPFVRESNGAWKAVPMRGEPQELTETAFEEILSEVLLDE